jgi:PhnO protein
MNPGITIRQAENQDAQKIFEFLCELEEGQFEYREFFLNYRNNIFASHNIYLVAANEQKQAIGFISCHGQVLLHHGGMVYEIQELFVDQAYRGQGIGRALLKALDEKLSKREYKSLEVTANSKRKETHQFYKKNGFEKTHVKFVRNSPKPQ